MSPDQKFLLYFVPISVGLILLTQAFILSILVSNRLDRDRFRKPIFRDPIYYPRGRFGYTETDGPQSRIEEVNLDSSRESSNGKD